MNNNNSPSKFKKFREQFSRLREQEKLLNKDKKTPFTFFKLGWKNTLTTKHVLFCLLTPFVFSFLMLSTQFSISYLLSFVSDKYNPNGSALSISLFFILIGPLFLFTVLFLKKEKERDIKIWSSFKKNWFVSFVWSLPAVILFSFIYVFFFSLIKLQESNIGFSLNIFNVSLYILLPMSFFYLYIMNGISFFSALAEKTSYNLNIEKSSILIFWNCLKLFLSNLHLIILNFGYTLVATIIVFIPIPVLIINYLFIVLGKNIHSYLPYIGYVLISIISTCVIIFSIYAFIKSMIEIYNYTATKKANATKNKSKIFTSNIYGKGVTQWRSKKSANDE